MIVSCRTLSLAKRLTPSLSKACPKHFSSPALPSNQITEQTSIISRHGVGDGVITLNVGGKNFLTLRSTISQNAVLTEYVMRAEANKELTQDAIFIDRDPKHFGMILSYLRNKADGLSSTRLGAQLIRRKINSYSSAVETIFLPQDQQSLQEIYYESMHYQIPELTAYVCTKGTLVRYLQMFGAKNPFQMAASALAVGKRVFLFLGTMATGMGGWAVTQATLSETQAKQSFNATDNQPTSGNDSVSKEKIVKTILKAWEDSAKK